MACDVGPNILACTLTMLVLQLTQGPYLYNIEWTASEIFGIIFNIFFCVAILTVLAMSITYIAMIRGQMSNLIKQSLNMFDKMHEGLLVLSKDDKSIQLVSKPAANVMK